MAGSRDLALVIDDDRYIAESTAMILESEGLDVVRAQSGEEGVRIAAERRPAVIVLDVMMPGLSGWETLEQLKLDPVTADIPVVVFSAREMQRARQVASEHGATDYLPKPFDPKDLIAKVQKHVRVGRSPAA